MTRRGNARLAGAAYLLYIALACPAMVISTRITDVTGTAAKLARIAEHQTEMRVIVVLWMLCCFAALVLAVTLYALTRDQDPDLALLAMASRVGEGVLSGTYVLATLGLIWLATSGATASDPAPADALGGFLLRARGWNITISATFFAVGSTLFSWLLLRGRMIPSPLAWLGVLASVLLLPTYPLQLAGFVRGAWTDLISIPMLLFEITLGIWLIIKGAAPPAARPAG